MLVLLVVVAPKETKPSAQPPNPVDHTSLPQGETEAPTATAADEHQPAAEDNARHGARVAPNPGNNNEHNNGANDRRQASGGEKQRTTDDDKRAVEGDDDGANEDTKTTKRGGKKDGPRRRSKQGAKDDPKGGGKEPATRSAIKRRSKRAGNQHNVGSPDKTAAPAQADECLSATAALSVLSPEGAPNDETPLGAEAAASPEAILSPEAYLSALVVPGGSSRPLEDSGAFESRRRGRKGSGKREHKSHRKDRRLDAEKRAAEESADAAKSPGAVSPSVGEARPTDAGGKPDTGAQATLKTSPHGHAGLASPDLVGSPSCVKSPPSDTQPEVASDGTQDPSSVTSPTGPAPGDQQNKASSEKAPSVAEKRTLVIHESPSHLAAAKEVRQAG
ncbi:hypothetical protein V5799_010580 [Amblyomma americanum]|uniref:Uncharacterized protein n=2 Tax=Amblyomma americanum TaxID=6943 RepID=A0AAQ4EJH7_AMBAM